MVAKNPKMERSSKDFVPYIRHCDPTTVVLSGRSLLSIIEVDGMSFQTADRYLLNAHHFAWNTLLRNVADDAVTLNLVTLRRRVRDYPEVTFPNAFSQSLDDRYRERMNGTELYRNRLLICVQRQPGIDPLEKASSFFGNLKAARKAGVEVDAEDIKKHHETVATLAAALEAQNARVLGIIDEDGVAFTAVGQALHEIVGGREPKVPLNRGMLANVIYQDRVVFGRESFEVRHEAHSTFGAAFCLKEYPATTNPLMFADLLTVPMELTLSQSFRFLGKSAAREKAELKAGQLTSTNDRASEQVADLLDAIGELESNAFVLGQHQLTAVIFGVSPKALNENMARVRSGLTQSGAVAVREDFGLQGAFWAMLPGNRRFEARSGLITSRCLASFAPLHGFAKGQRDNNHWGPSVAVLRSSAGSPYYFNFHRADVGHTFICGPSGSGKTVVMNFLLSQVLKVRPRMVLIDKDRGAEAFVCAVGGRYLALKNGQSTGLAPLKYVSLEGSGAVWIERWIGWLAGGVLSVQERHAVAGAISALALVPPALRSITALRGYLDNTDPAGVSARLVRWQTGHSLGWVFDGPQDVVNFENPIVGFDLTDFLDNDEIRAPVMGYLFHRVEETLQRGEKVIIAIDEFWRALGDVGFAEFIRDKLKTMRKLNGMFVFATQSPADALKSGIADTIIDQCATQIYMPNVRAAREHYIDGMKLTEREYELIQKEMSDTQRQFLIRQGSNSVVAELNLNGFDRELSVLSGRQSNLEVLDAVRREVGNDPKDWLPLFYARNKAA